MFDFLKDGKHAEKKYKSTNQIPFMFSGEDLLSNKDTNMECSGGANMFNKKDEEFTPFFAIEEDMEMEDEISQSDGFTSEAGHESIESDSTPGDKGKQNLHFDGTLICCLWLRIYSQGHLFIISQPA